MDFGAVTLGMALIFIALLEIGFSIEPVDPQQLHPQQDPFMPDTYIERDIHFCADGHPECGVSELCPTFRNFDIDGLGHHSGQGAKGKKKARQQSGKSAYRPYRGKGRRSVMVNKSKGRTDGSARALIRGAQSVQLSGAM